MVPTLRRPLRTTLRLLRASRPAGPIWYACVLRVRVCLPSSTHQSSSCVAAVSDSAGCTGCNAPAAHNPGRGVLTQGTRSTHMGYFEYSHRVLRVITRGTRSGAPRLQRIIVGGYSQPRWGVVLTTRSAGRARRAGGRRGVGRSGRGPTWEPLQWSERPRVRHPQRRGRERFEALAHVSPHQSRPVIFMPSASETCMPAPICRYELGHGRVVDEEAAEARLRTGDA
jgi:hypothetical protein